MIFNKLTLALLATFFSLAIFGQNIKEGELLVLLKQKVSVDDFCTVLNKEYSSIHIKQKESISKRLNAWVLEYNSLDYTPGNALEVIASKPAVEIVQFNHTNISLRGDSCPKDPLFSAQWSLNNTGQNSGVVGADIDACKAWGITTNTTTANGDTIVVAVIDDGFYLKHSDVNFFRNYNEIAYNGIDDDGNGYIDDTLGWNTYTDSNNIVNRSHGTMVSGIIGAKANNGIGVSGINWGMKVLPIQGSSSIESTVLKSYGYVLDMRALYDSTNGAKGAFVVATNSSFGIDFATPSSFPLWCAFYDSLGKYGILNVTATANANVNVDVQGDIPTTCVSEYLIAVTNTDKNDTKVSSSGFGFNHIDIGAPGELIRSTTNGNGYFVSSGTSLSTPHVAGAVGFMYAAACQEFINDYSLYPDSMARLVKKIILENGDSIPSLLGITVSGQRLNLFKSAKKIRTDYNCQFTSIESKAKLNSSLTIYPNPNNGTFNLELKDFENGEYTYSLIDITGKTIYNNRIVIGNENSVISISPMLQVDKGVYIFCLKSDKNTNYFTKFVVSDNELK